MNCNRICVNESSSWSVRDIEIPSNIPDSHNCFLTTVNVISSTVLRAASPYATFSQVYWHSETNLLLIWVLKNLPDCMGFPRCNSNIALLTWPFWLLGTMSWSVTGNNDIPPWDGKFQTSAGDFTTQWRGKSPAPPYKSHLAYRVRTAPLS